MSFRFDVNSPAAKKLGEQVFEKIKELWDPALKDDSVAQYAVALVARGGDRKKIFSNLKGLLGDEATNLLLDWLLKHVKAHRNELTASTATAAGKTSKKDSSKSKSAGAQASVVQASGKETDSIAQPVVDDVEALLREGEEEEDDHADTQTAAAAAAAVDTAHSASHQKDNEDAVALQATASTHNNNKATNRTSSKAVKPSDGKTTAAKQESGHHQKTNESLHSAQTAGNVEQPQATQQTGKKQRMRSAIQWVAPSGTAAETSTQPDDSTAEARKARFHEADKSSHDAKQEGRRSRDGTRDRERDRIRHDDRRVSPARHGRDRSRSPGWRDRRNRSPVSLREREHERHTYNEQGHDDQRYTGRGAAPHDSHWLGHHPDQYQDIDHRDQGGSFRDRDGFRHPGPIDTIPRHNSPPPHLPTSPTDGRPRLRSAVSGSADLNQQLEAATQERQPDRVLGAGRLLGQSLARAIGGGGSVFSRIKRPGKPSDVDQGEREPASTIDKLTTQGEHQSVFERTRGKRAISQEPDTHAGEPAAAAGTDHHVRPPAKVARGIEQPDKSSREHPQPSTGHSREAAATHSTVPGSSKGAGMEQQESKVLPQSGQLPKVATQPSSNGTAAVPHTQQPGSATAGKQTHIPTPAGAAKPAGALHKPAPVAPAAAVKSVPEVDEMTKLMEELKRKELEINRMKGQLAIQQGSAPASTKAVTPAGAPAVTAGGQQQHAAAAAAEAAKRAEADSRSVVVQNLHFGATEELLKTHFSFCGPVTRVTILRDKMTQLPYGSGYVEFVTVEGKQRALELNNSMFLNQMIRVFPKPTRIMTTMPVASKPVVSGIAPAGPKRLADAAPLSANGAMSWRRPTGQPAAS